jgi:ubiquinone/menaquinone biosynthesis C-methylase UbiE
VSAPRLPTSRAGVAASSTGRAGAWDRAARWYDLQAALEGRALDAALELASPETADRLLDVATGTGALLRRLATRPVLPGRVVGVDASRAMLARAPELPAGWQLVVADATRLPFAQGSFDVLTAVYLLHLLDQPARAAVLSEAARVLADGGRLVVVTVTAPPSSAAGALLTGLAAWARRGSGIIAGLCPLDPRPELRAAGFGVLRTRRTTRGYPSLVVLAQPERNS